ncbi:hypothetical protein ACOI1C_12215 [Bacillus sp. DJP31]|uniref:hypothetical protein n=1 Tax=Bacillus sp. DJP31 TaxID=3409789 RepID=UPI003BB49B98
MDSIGKDHIRFNHYWHTTSNMNNYPNFNITFEEYGMQIENTLKELRGFQYTEEEVNITIQALNHTSDELYRLVDNREFNIEKEADRRQVLETLKPLAEKMAEIDR